LETKARRNVRERGRENKEKKKRPTWFTEEEEEQAIAKER
jgi:hypothetical protein